MIGLGIFCRQILQFQAVDVDKIEKYAPARSVFPIFAMIERIVTVKNAAAYFYIAIPVLFVRIGNNRNAAGFVERMVLRFQNSPVA